MVGVPVRREQVAYARRRGLSQRRSCTLLTVARSALSYRSAKTVRDAPVLARMAALSAQYPRYGYRRIRIFLGRDECLSLEWFRSRAEAKAVIEAWRRHYNHVRPHSSLGYLTPAEFVTKLKENDAAPAPATGRDAAVDGASAPRPVAAPSLTGQSKAQETPGFSG